ncbi:hypothetical protein V6O07_00990, partial [Arthrospira platensis SPKY2]
QWLTELAQRALVIVSGESPSRWMSLHDVPQKYLREQVQNPATLHRDWLRSYGGGQFPWTGAEVAAEVYLYRQGLYHFREAGEIAAFRRLLWDFDWLQGKLEATDSRALLADFEAVTVGESRDSGLKRLEEALRLSAHVLEKDSSQLVSQLWGRLLSFVDSPQPYRYFWERIPIVGLYLPKYAPRQGQKVNRSPLATAESSRIAQLLTQAEQWQDKPWFRPLIANLTPPGGPLIRTFAGHSDSVQAVAITPDGKRAVSASGDKTLKLWDLETGTELATLTGHSDEVRAVAITLPISGNEPSRHPWIKP